MGYPIYIQDNNNKNMKDKIMVSKWGYSMILSTWVKVVQESPKTLLVQEMNGRSLSSEELDAQGLKPAWLQAYTVVTETARTDSKPFRLYKNKSGDGYHGKPGDMSTTLYFDIWDGKPEFEDHCD